MNAKEQIKNTLNELVADGATIMGFINSKNGNFEFSRSYQAWYTKSIKLISVLAPDRLKEFQDFYHPDPKRKGIDIITYRIQDFINGFGPRNNSFGEASYNPKELALIYLTNQILILNSLTSRIDGVLADIEATLIAGVQDAELATAETLKKVSLRAAGALAGVILEGHLQRVVSNHGIKIAKKNPTVADMNEPLKQAGVYDVITWRKVQYLADIRNLCSHKKDQEPSVEQITELINGVDWVIKNVA
jgi:hypothetical protein